MIISEGVLRVELGIRRGGSLLQFSVYLWSLILFPDNFIDTFLHHTIHPYKVYNSIVFNVFIQLSPRSVFKHFHHPKRKHCPH